jgi:hypothetical protein
MDSEMTERVRATRQAVESGMQAERMLWHAKMLEVVEALRTAGYVSAASILSGEVSRLAHPAKET